MGVQVPPRPPTCSSIRPTATQVMPSLQDESFTQLADEERRRDDKIRSSQPYVRFALIVVVILGVVVAGGLLIRNRLQAREVAAYQSYMSQVADIVTRSNDVGAKLSTLITAPGNATRKDVQTKLDHQQIRCRTNGGSPGSESTRQPARRSRVVNGVHANPRTGHG